MENSQNIDGYKTKLDGKMNEWNADAEKLAATAKKSGPEAETKYRNAVADITAKEGVARTKLTEFGVAGKDKSPELKTGLEKAFTELNAAVDKARALPH